MICTISPGRRSRSRPSSSARGSVVAASRIEATTPSVPLARMFQAPSSPDSLSASPSTSTVSPRATNGSSTANSTNGTSTTIRRRPPGTAPGPPAPPRRAAAAYTPNAQNCSFGVATTTRTNSSTAASLHCGGSRWTTRVAGPVERVRRGRDLPLIGGRSSPSRLAAADGEDQAADEGERHARRRRRRRARRTAARCRRPWRRSRRAASRRGRAPSPSCEALVAGDLLQPVRGHARVVAHDAGEQQRHDQRRR